MGRTTILSTDTLSALLEAHASMAAWYYELWAAARDGRAPAMPPDEARRAHLERVAGEFPDVAAIARSIHAPRMYVPAPPEVAPPLVVAPRPDEG